MLTRACLALVASLTLAASAQGQMIGGRGPQIAEGLYDPIQVAHPSCTPRVNPVGPTIQLGPQDADLLPSTVLNAAPGTVILLEDGVYTFSFQGEAFRRLRFEAPNVTLTSVSKDATRVIIDGEYLTQEMVYITASNITLSHITLTGAVDHLIHLVPLANTPITNFDFYGLRLIDSGEQFIKSNPDAGRTAWADDAEVACSVFLLTDDGRPNVEPGWNGCYTGGIDVHGGRGWHVHHNIFEGIYCKNGGDAEHAVHFWRSARDTLVEHNVLINNARGIGFGLDSAGESRAYADNPCPAAGGGYIGHYGGIIRGNVIFNDNPWYDSGISLEQACNIEVLNNTIYSTTEATGLYSSIEYRWPNTTALIQNNIARIIRQRDGASGNEVTNIEGASDNLFVRPNGRRMDFRLRATATSAVNQGTSHGSAGVDLDGNARSNGNPDIGAYERQ